MVIICQVVAEIQAKIHIMYNEILMIMKGSKTNELILREWTIADSNSGGDENLYSMKFQNSSFL